MLPSQTLLHDIRSDGMAAGYRGDGIVTCPWQEEKLARAWRAGWKAGASARTIDLKEAHKRNTRNQRHA